MKINNSTVNTALQNHPDWPSLLCINDSLTKWNIPNAAGKIDPHQIDELPTPFLAYTNNREFPLSVVSKVTDTDVAYFSGNYRKVIIKRKEDFLKEWSGIYLIAEPSAESGEVDFVQKRRKSFMKSMISVSLIAVLFILSLFSLYNDVNLYGGSAKAIYIYYAVYLAGIIVTTLLLWYETDRNNPLLQKVCTGIAKGNCNAILTSRKSKVFPWLSWSEVGFFYFTGGLLVLLFSGDINKSVALLNLLSLIAFPYVFFSVYYQWRVAKQWCVLCLSVQALLVVGGLNAFLGNLIIDFSFTSTTYLTTVLLIYLLPVLLWYSIKPYILHLQEAKNTKREHLRIKFNPEVFETLLKKEKQITMPSEDLGINIGNPNATNTLVKVCNPYCGPCSKAHPKIDELLEKIANLKVKMIFTIYNNPENLAYKPVSHFLAINENSNYNEIIKKVLDDWYTADKKDYALFAKKYPLNGELELQSEKINGMRKWCDETGISYTPTFFINGYKLPDAYRLEDLQYFLSE